MNEKFLKEYNKKISEDLRKQPKISREEMLRQTREIMSGKAAESNTPALSRRPKTTLPEALKQHKEVQNPDRSRTSEKSQS